MKKCDFKQGQTVYLYPWRLINAHLDRVIEQSIVEAKVLTVGRRYLTVEYAGIKKSFDIYADFREVNTPSPMLRLYLSKEDIFRDSKRNQRKTEICNLIKHRGILDLMTNDDIEAILNILHKYKRY